MQVFTLSKHTFLKKPQRAGEVKLTNPKPPVLAVKLCITASENILAGRNLCFRVFKLQLKVINKNVCFLYNVKENQIN